MSKRSKYVEEQAREEKRIDEKIKAWDDKKREEEYQHGILRESLIGDDETYEDSLMDDYNKDLYEKI